MPNPFYNVTNNPIARTLGRSDVMRAEFALVEDGFDETKAQLDLKAPLASPTFTGTVTFNTSSISITTGSVDASSVSSFLVPTVSLVSDATNKAASTAFVIAAIGASGTMLPPQATHDGKFLRSNGVSASWQHIVGLGLGSYLNVTSSQTITGDARNLDFSSAPAGTVATLPAANTLPLHTVFTLLGGGTNVGVATPSGDLLLAISGPGQQVLLTNNSTADGTWRIIADYLQSSAPASARWIVGQSTTLRSVSASGRGAALGIGSDRALVVALGGGGTGVEAYVATVSGNSVSIGSVTSVVASGAVHWIRLLQVTGGYVVAWTTSATSQIQVAGLAVSGTTVTASAPTAIGNAIASTSSLSMVDVAIEASGAAVVALYRRNGTTVEAVAATFSGSSAPTVGSAVTFLTTGTTLNYGSAALASLSAGTLVGAFSCEDSSPAHVAQARVITLTGATISLGGALSISGVGFLTGHGPIAVARVTATTALLVAKETSATNTAAAVATVSGTSLSLGSSVGWGTVSLTSSPAAAGVVAHLVDVGSGAYLALAGAANANETCMASLSVSGATVTRNGTSQQASQLTNSLRPVSPQPGWAAFSLGGAFALFSFQTVAGSGIGFGSGSLAPTTAGAFTATSGVSPSPIGVIRMQTGKRLLVVQFDTVVRAQVVQYGGDAP
jgi:hypothetical protein